MDIARAPKKKRGKYIAIGAGVVAFILLTLVLGSLPTAAPSVERSTLLIDSVQRRDYPVVQGMTIFIAALFIVINLLVDILYGLVDPRVRYGSRH